jgi:hypothetical protein
MHVAADHSLLLNLKFLERLIIDFVNLLGTNVICSLDFNPCILQELLAFYLQKQVLLPARRLGANAAA